jgi:1,4-dihydroxy-2-naphthoyl-CoA synthase
MKHYLGASNPMRAQFHPKADYAATHFGWHYEAGVGTITLNRPEKKNPLTFDSYAELRDLFRALRQATDVKCRWWSPAPAATSAPAVTCTRSSAA